MDHFLWNLLLFQMVLTEMAFEVLVFKEKIVCICAYAKKCLNNKVYDGKLCSEGLFWEIVIQGVAMPSSLLVE